MPPLQLRPRSIRSTRSASGTPSHGGGLAPRNFNVSDIPAELCDAVIYSHVTIDNNTGQVKLTEKELELDPEAKAYSKSFFYNPIWMLPPHRAFREMSELKKRNPKLKLLLAIGGPHETIDRYWQFIPQMHLWRDMAISIAQWVKTYGFDGIVLDFFSGTRTAHDSEWLWSTAKLIDHFIWQIGQRFKEVLGEVAHHPHLPAFDSSTHYLFDINRLSQQVNFFFVKSSDCLEFPRGAGLNVSRTMDMSDIDRIELIVKRGAERTRVVPEVPLSGRTYLATGAGIGRHTVFAGQPGNYTKQQGFLSSFEVCDQLQSGWQQGRSSHDSCPYLKNDDDYVAYEDEESVRKKASMIIGRKFRGAVVTSVDLDDYNSKCAGKSNLVKVLRSSFDAATPDMDYPYNPPTAPWWGEDIFKLMPTTAPPPKRTTTRPPEVSTEPQEKQTAGTKTPKKGQPVTSSVTLPASRVPPTVPNTPEEVAPTAISTAPVSGEPLTTTPAESSSKSSTLATGTTEAVTKSSDDICKGVKPNAMLPHESDCSKYYHCVHSKPHLQNCAPGTIFDIERQICNWPAITNRPECKLS
ncbi:chitinase-3-like protein 1 [Rhipicephalus sanguineus]|uniref:chitinase-3-like protein 1 n=1 Tax=Rhipicephalus sanguineus TaxID=34632 RepID=UPI001894FB6C|nr:chitinase-3-like protein 1 [Rhipicephalus sanguineus]